MRKLECGSRKIRRMEGRRKATSTQSIKKRNGGNLETSQTEILEPQNIQKIITATYDLLENFGVPNLCRLR